MGEQKWPKGEESVIFIRHSSWVEDEGFSFTTSVEESELEHKLEILDDYLETMESFLDAEAQRYSKGLEGFPAERRKKLGGPLRLGQPHSLADLIDADEIDELAANLHKMEEFASLLRKSFFATLYSFLEAELNRECQMRQKADNTIKLSLEDIHGTGINRAKTYLVKVLGSNFPFATDPQWQEVQWYNRLRNCIVHNEGRITDERLKRYVDGEKGLSYETFFGGDYLVFEAGFCRKALFSIGALLRSMLYYRQADEIL